MLRLTSTGRLSRLCAPSEERILKMQRSVILLLLLTAVFAGVLVNAQDRRDRDRDRDGWVYERDGNNTWDRSWNQRPYPRAGACFFKDAGFEGDHFCVRRGDMLRHLPGEFGDNISSIRLFGNARVRVFNDRNFTGGSHEFGNSVEDLRNRRFRDGHTWNNRISSVAVR
jgi:Peptidase inhibitor family I36